MAKSAATWEGRRALTDNPETSPEVSSRAAEELMKMGLLSEAAVFFGLAGNEEGLMTIIDQAVEEGNFFVFKQAVSRLKEKKFDDEKVRTLASVAEKQGKALYAEQAMNYLENK